MTLRWVAALAALTGRGDAAAPPRRTGGAERGFLTHLFEQRHLDRLAPEDPAGPPPTLREAVPLARRELAAVVRAQGEELPQATDTGQPGAADGNRFQLEGAVWTLSFADRTVRLPDAKGLHDLAVLLGRPGRELHCTELVTEGRPVADQAALGPTLDAQARRRYQARIVELQEDLVDAEDANDRGRAEQAARRWACWSSSSPPPPGWVAAHRGPGARPSEPGRR